MQARCFSLKLAFVATFNKGSCPMLLNDVGDGVVEADDGDIEFASCEAPVNIESIGAVSA